MRIGQYEVLRELGSGAMGAVCLAEDQHLGPKVAIKRILMEAADEDALKRFYREGKAVAQVAHPNIVGLHHLLEDQGSAYLIMEFVEGGDLAKRLRGGHLSPEFMIPSSRF